MVWVKLSDSFADEMEVLDLSTDAFTLQVAALCYCNRLVGKLATDGVVPRRKAAGLYSVDDSARAIKELLEKGIWEETDDGYSIVGYLEDQKSSEQVKAERAATALRVDRSRKHAKGDHSLCSGSRWCNAVTSGATNGASNSAPARPDPTRPKGRGGEGTAPPSPLPGGRGDAPPSLGQESSQPPLNPWSIPITIKSKDAK